MVFTDVLQFGEGSLLFLMAIPLAKLAGVFLARRVLSLCGDNGAMIAAQAYYNYLAGELADETLNAYATSARRRHLQRTA